MPLCVANTSCIAIVAPYATFTILLMVLNLFESTPTIVEVLVTLLKSDCRLILLSFPAISAAFLNLNVPIPTEVVPNPTVLDLRVAVFIPVFSKLIDKTPPVRFEVNVPIKFDEKLLIVPLST